MSRTIEQMAEDLDALSPRDFDEMNTEADGPERLRRICDEMLQMGDVAACAPGLFRTMERLDTVDLGSLGPIVHALERWTGGYESLLSESVRRKPSPLAVWMVNRILNAGPADAPEWLDLLRGVADHPSASAETKAEARDFLEYQESEATLT